MRSAPADSGFAAGQRVSGLSMLGGWAERVALPPASVLPTPDGIDDGAAVCLLGNYYTMYFALVRRAALLAGETVLVLGSAGGVGTAAIQIAKALGAKVIAMVHRPGAMDFVESLGADVVLPLTDGWAQAVREHTDGRGVDVVVDPVGGDAFDDAIRVLATEGRLLVLGFASGGGIPTVKVNRLLLRNVSVVGVGLGEFINRTPGAQAEIGAGLGKLVDAGLRPPPPVRYPLSEGRAALREPGRRRHPGQGRAGAVSERRPLRPCAFDVFGTVVDWRSSIIGELEMFGESHGLAEDWATFADDWRAGYPAAMDRVRKRRAAVAEDRRAAPPDPRRPARPGRDRIRPGRGRRRPQPRVAPAGPVAGLRRGPDAPQAAVRHHDAVERQRVAADEHGQARGAAVGLRDLRRAVPPLQAGPRGVPRLRRPARRRHRAS